MKKPTAMLAELKKKSKPNKAGRSRVRVGMATCGISAGADEVYEAFTQAVKQAGLTNVEVIATGCVGRCDLEPMAEVLRAGEPPVLYIRLDADKVKRIVDEHLVGGNIVKDFVG